MEFTIEQLNETIAQISRSQAAANKGIGKALLMCLYFANVKSDAGAANALVNCLRKSTKQQGIVALLEDLGNLAFMKSAKKPTFEFFDAGHNAESFAACVKEARELCADWESYKPTPVKLDVLDIIAALESLQKKVKKAQADHVELVGAEALDAINLIVATFNANKIDAAL
jgi:hypothetical protein